jgi:hypothetical protein
MKNWKQVSIPSRMLHLERDDRGYPIPFIAAHIKDEPPNFKLNDDRKAFMALAYRKCMVCGTDLLEDMWLVGAAISMFKDMGAFIDSLVHEECGRYSLMVCPFLSTTAYQLAGKKEELDGKLVSNRSPFMVFGKIADFYVVSGTFSNRYIMPRGSFRVLEYWSNGSIISEEKARDLFNSDPRIQNLIGPGKDFQTLPRWN